MCTTGYPILWLLEDFRVLDHVVIYIIHVLLDIITKVVFGFCIVRFQFLLSKMDLRMDDLKVGVELHRTDTRRETALAPPPHKIMHPHMRRRIRVQRGKPNVGADV